MWSRVRALDGYSEVAERKLRNLAFHDFVEAIVRLSLMVPLPTDKEIKEVTARDAGEYIITLQEACSKTFGDFVLKNKRTFDQEPKQKVQRCVEHLLNLIARIIEQNTGGTQDLKIDEHEADQFLKRMRAGNQLRRKAASLGGADLVAAFEGAQDAVRRKLFDSLREVMVFSGLSDSQVEMLRDAMMLAPFDTGDYIFEQDEDGDTFYVITKGEAKVLRTEDENEPDKVLAELKEGAYFGERALLKNDRRFASVMAVTELETMCITREGADSFIFSRTCGVTDWRYCVQSDGRCLIHCTGVKPQISSMTQRGVHMRVCFDYTRGRSGRAPHRPAVGCWSASRSARGRAERPHPTVAVTDACGLVGGHGTRRVRA
eukprot:4056920-Prymnesium_polylepis.1